MLHRTPCQLALRILAMLQVTFIAHPANASEALYNEPMAAQIGNATQVAARRAQPADKVSAGKGPSANSATVRVAKHTTKTLAKKIFLPLRISLAELSHPVELFKSAQRHIWPDNRNAQISGYPGDQGRTGRVFDVGLNSISTYRLTDETIRLASQDKSMDRFGVPSSYVAPESASRISATQLQVRMSEEWSFLYELDRLDADTGADKLSWGLGLRHAF